jgi:hypothetical protein
VTPILLILLGVWNALTGAVFLLGLIDRFGNESLLARLLGPESNWSLGLWAFGLLFAGVSQVYGVIKGKWWCAVFGSNMALAAYTFSAMVYLMNFDSGWTLLLTYSVGTVLLNGYAMLLSSVASLRLPHSPDFGEDFRLRRNPHHPPHRGDA